MSPNKKLRQKVGAYTNEIGRLRERIAWLERRPPWWQFRAVRKWREEEPK